ncbi:MULTISPECIES: HD domain-containing phosphohydrolase [unclassified Oceanispirochaeta]|uniref:HD domain-containing phosphohydrolase n=1 Tax=unclassified Oceanispirochaeta TaxID=2635722 RepID=UPI00131495BE|nr:MULTISPECIES: HD domain-containing phosphohydrolase [unclassified Oceanispirochaeta]MBF9017200.1 HD domain-containing protein [Oceanispirochaeta sp. M2]NPD73649.1 HD domain-containing protein [Oceanispirochaeta sp. M1]
MIKLKNIRKEQSIYKQSIKQDRFLYLILTFFICSILVLLFFRISSTQIEKDSSLLFAKLNRVATTVTASPYSVSDGVHEAYEDVIKISTSLESRKLSPSRFLVYKHYLPEPMYTTEDEKTLYMDQFRQYAASIRGRTNTYLHLLLMVVYILLGLISFLVIVFYFFYSSIKSSINDSLVIIQKGINMIDSRLNMELFDSFNVPDDAPEEILALSHAIYRIDKDIELDQKIDTIESYGSISEILEYLASALDELIPMDRIALAFNDSDGRVTAESAFVKYQKVWLEPGYSEFLSNTSLNKMIHTGNGRIMNDLPSYARQNSVSESTKLILKEGIRSSMTIPLQSNQRCVGFLFISSRESNVYNQFHLKVAQRIAKRLKHRFFHEYLSQELIAESANSFVGLMNERDNETSEHISRMSLYSFTIAKNLSRKDFSIRPGFPREILWFAPLHDIGKISIPDNVLLKKGPLTSTEFEVMKQHVNSGLKIIKGMNLRIGSILNQSVLKVAEDIISGHHEKYDGSGYPEGLKGREIPLAGRIAAIADVFDALTSKRSYKRAFSIEEALNIMEVEMKGSFDPYLYECFQDSMDEFLEIYRTHQEDS